MIAVAVVGLILGFAVLLSRPEPEFPKLTIRIFKKTCNIDKFSCQWDIFAPPKPPGTT
jgi:hypothetical protein